MTNKEIGHMGKIKGAIGITGMVAHPYPSCQQNLHLWRLKPLGL